MVKIVNLLLFIVTLSFFSYLINAQCCKPYLVSFKTINENCEFFGAYNDFYQSTIGLRSDNSKQCVIRLCGNGELISERNYCGKGFCNRFGCNCNEGCIEGNAVTNFQTLHENDVYNVMIH